MVGTTTSYTDSQVSANTAYQYALSAFDAAGNTSNVSPAISVTTPPVASPPPSGTRSYTTQFNTTERPLSEGGAWRRANNSWTDVEVVNGVAFGSANAIGYDDAYSLLSGFGPEQTVEATVFRDANLSPGETHEVELLLRFSDDASNARGYECLFSYYGGIALMRWNGRQGDFSHVQLTQSGYFGRNLRTGDIVTCTIRGNVITGYINGMIIAKGVDSTFSSGQPGVGFFSRPGGSPRLLGLTSFTARDGG
jgi:hypothetical protein